MEELLKASELTIKHLSVLDKVFRETYRPYKYWSEKLNQEELYRDLVKEIYAGGKKTKGKRIYSRQMILGDFLEYIITGRGYYFAVKGEKEFKTFIRIIMYIANLLILMEDISAESELRKVVLELLSKEIGENLFEDEEQRKLYQNLLSYDGPIIRKKKMGEKYEIIFDSLLPKRVGIVPELLTYCWLIRKNYGYVVPLLLAQRLLGKGKYIVPPDFLLIRSKGEIFGLEVGAGREKQKERQIALFSSITGIPVFIVGIGTIEQPQPYRCDKCLKWITYCPFVIDLCSENKDSLEVVHLSCSECKIYRSFEDIEKCPFTVYYGKAENYVGEVTERRYHYACVREDPLVRKKVESEPQKCLVAPIPVVYGIEHLSEEK